MLRQYTISRDDSVYECFPDMVKTKSGKLICVFRESTHHGDLNGSRLVYTESLDNGKTWSEKQGLTEKTDASFAYNCPRISCLPNGEYRSYDYNLTSLWNIYINRFNALYEVFFNGGAGDSLLCCDNCLEVLSKIENIETPELLKPYHDDVISALSTEREFCMAVKAIAELSREYQGLERDELPADVQEEVMKHSETIDNYFGQENGAHTASNKAVHAALEFAKAQAGQ